MDRRRQGVMAEQRPDEVLVSEVQRRSEHGHAERAANLERRVTGGGSDPGLVTPEVFERAFGLLAGLYQEQ